MRRQGIDQWVVRWMYMNTATMGPGIGNTELQYYIRLQVAAVID